MTPCLMSVEQLIEICVHAGSAVSQHHTRSYIDHSPPMQHQSAVQAKDRSFAQPYERGTREQKGVDQMSLGDCSAKDLELKLAKLDWQS